MNATKNGVTAGVVLAMAAACGGSDGTSVGAADGGASTDATTDGGADGALGDGAFGDGATGDGAPGDGASGDGAAGCPPYQKLCAGRCIPVANDPANCGGCGVACTGNTVCSAGACANDCPIPLTPCNHACVDTATDNDNCGGCGRKCGAGTGCSGGSCVTQVTVGPPPATCANGGPPIVINGQCSGQTAQTTFRWALCSCKDVTMSSRLVTDAYDSTQGPYVPGGLGGGVGLNGAFNATSDNDVYGALWSSSSGGVTTSSSNNVRRELHVGGSMTATGTFVVGDDGYVTGDVNGTGSIAFARSLHVSPTSNIRGNVTHGTLVNNAPVVVPPPCDCAPQQIIPVASIVASFRSHNDDAAIGLSPTALATPRGAAVRLDLPCGYYYLSKIDNGQDPVTIVAHGHTALFVDGDATGGPLSFSLDATATFDVYLAGVVKPWPGSDFNYGSPNFPALMRIYSGGTAPTELSAGTFAGEFYAATSPIVAQSLLTAYGAMYAGDFRSSAEAQIHYDRAVLGAGSVCPPPPPPPSDGGTRDGSAGTDGGSSGCTSCRDCGNQACNGGTCGACGSSADCCAPLICLSGTCVVLR